MTRPKADHARPPMGTLPPPLGKGEVRRSFPAVPREDRDEALARARRDFPWGPRIVGNLSRTGPATWTARVRESDSEKLARLRALEQRRAAGGGR